VGGGVIERERFVELGRRGDRRVAGAFTSRSVWSADITVEAGERKVVIEYDGSYWHSPAAKRLIDERKSRDLLAAGYVVVRLREDDLPPLRIEHDSYREIRVYSSAPQPQQVMDQIRDWVYDNC